LVFDHQRRERRLEIAPDIGLGVEADAFGILAFVGGVDRLNEGGRARIGREGWHGEGRASGAENHSASCQHAALGRRIGRSGSRAGRGSGVALPRRQCVFEKLPTGALAV
jgi:hypothetical protein